MMSVFRPLFVMASLVLLIPGSLIAQTVPVPAKPLVRIVYFTPTDRKPEPDRVARLDRVMKHVQEFYRAGMKQNGYGNQTFQLERDTAGELVLHEVAAKGPMSDYGRNSSTKVRDEIKTELKKRGMDIDRETIVIFQQLLEWKDNEAIEVGSYVGGGGPYSGTAWVYDDAMLDPKLLSSTEPGGYYHGKCSKGKFNTHYIGGVAHELGHGFGLPHDCERSEDRARMGNSLMGAGNHTYGREARREGLGAFLSPASALPLAVHPAFTGTRRPDANVNAQLHDLKAEYIGKEIVVSGRVTGTPKLTGVVLLNDQVAIASDYDAVGAAAILGSDNQFSLKVGDLKPGAYQMRLTVYADNGRDQTFSFDYNVDDKGRPDLSPFVAKVWLERGLAAYQKKDRKALTVLITEASQQLPEEIIVMRKLIHLNELLALPATKALVAMPNSVTNILLSNITPTSTKVGYGQAVRNQVPIEGGAGPWLQVSGELFTSGFYAHAPARHVWQPNAMWQTLTTKYGLQDGHDGSVIFIIKGDGKELFRSRRINDHKVREQTIDIAKVQTLELLIEDASDGTSGDWGVWLAPTLKR